MNSHQNELLNNLVMQLLVDNEAFQIHFEEYKRLKHGKVVAPSEATSDSSKQRADIPEATQPTLAPPVPATIQPPKTYEQQPSSWPPPPPQSEQAYTVQPPPPPYYFKSLSGLLDWMLSLVVSEMFIREIPNTLTP